MWPNKEMTRYFHNRQDNREPRLLLLCGSGHNGSTILTRILLDHPMIGGTLSETFAFGLTSKAEWRGVLEQLAYRAKSKKWVVEKTPLHLFNAKDLLEIFPNAKSLLLLRDGREVVASMLMRSLSVRSAVQRWTTSCRELLVLRGIHPTRTHVVRYEELISDRDRVLQNIAEFTEISVIPLIKASVESREVSYLGFRVSSYLKEQEHKTHEDCDYDLVHTNRRAMQASLPLTPGIKSKWEQLDSEIQREVQSHDDFMMYMRIFQYAEWGEKVCAA